MEKKSHVVNIPEDMSRKQVLPPSKISPPLYEQFHGKIKPFFEALLILRYQKDKHRTEYLLINKNFFSKLKLK